MIAAIKKWFADWWAAHGTKILGFGGAIVSTLSLIDHETIQLIEGTIGSFWAHIITIIGSLTVAYRGFKNSQKSASGNT